MLGRAGPSVVADDRILGAYWPCLASFETTCVITATAHYGTRNSMLSQLIFSIDRTRGVSLLPLLRGKIWICFRFERFRWVESLSEKWIAKLALKWRERFSAIRGSYY